MEAPGTAPGSAVSIPQSVYRHSQQADDLYIAWKSLTERAGVFWLGFEGVSQPERRPETPLSFHLLAVELDAFMSAQDYTEPVRIS